MSLEGTFVNREDDCPPAADYEFEEPAALSPVAAFADPQGICAWKP